MSGAIPFNEHYRMIVDQYNTTGEVISHFNDDPTAIVDPMLRYKRDPFWFQNLETMAQFNPEALQAYFATRKDNMKILKMFIQDYLEDKDIDRS